MVKMLAEAGFRTTVFDNLSRGHRDAVLSGDFIQGDLLNPAELKNLFDSQRFDLVMHFAAFCYVGESVSEPLKYYRNNVSGTLNLLEEMKAGGVDKIVFSSTCATYGIPIEIPITETHPQKPINPYGQSKLMVERLLKDSAAACDLKSISLRYFNAAGCDPEGLLGERHVPETHLIPLALREALRITRGGRPEDTGLRVFGADFETPDSTCIRDYIHIQDLCSAHMLAMRRLLNDKAEGFEAYNLGNGSGFSVREVIGTCSRITGVDIKYKLDERRPGDPPQLVGGSEKAGKVLGWKPDINTLERIIETAWQWFSKKGNSL
jgi:UDP-glucose-4-epimerase GalE